MVPWVVAVLLLVAGPLWAGDNVLDQLLREDAPAPAVRFTFPARRIAGLEQQVAARVARLRLADPMTTRAVRADVNLRLIARSLLKAGLATTSDDAPIALLYGVTIADHADTVAAVTATLPRRAAAARLPGSTDAQVDAVRGMIDNLDRFNAASQNTDDLPAKFTAADIDAYLQRHLQPLAAALRSAGQPGPVTTWIAAGLADAQPAAPLRVTGAQMDELEKRVQSAAVSTTTKTELLWTAGMVRSGMADAKLAPKVGGVYEMLELASRCAAALGPDASLDEKTAADLRGRLHTAAVLLRDPRTRASAKQRLDQIDRITRLAAALNGLDRLAAPVAPLRHLLAAAASLQQTGHDDDTADVMLDDLDRLTAAMQRYRSMLGAKLPLELRKIALRVRHDYQQHELRTVASLSEAAAHPGLLTEEATAQDLADLIEQVQQLRRVQAIPADVERLKRFKPRAADRLFAALCGIAEEPTGPRDDNPRTLEKLERTLAAIDPMPGEVMLESGGPIDAGTRVVLQGQLERLRQDWAGAWATGGDPGVAAAKMAMIARLLTMAATGEHTADLAAAAGRLNRWAGWQVSDAAIRGSGAAMGPRVESAARLAAAGNWAALGPALAEMERSAALGTLVMKADAALGAGLSRVPDGAAGLMSECLEKRGAGAWGGGRRREWAELAMAVEEVGATSGGEAREWVARVSEMLLKP